MTKTTTRSRAARRELDDMPSQLAALETMNDFDVGGFTVTYTPSDHSGSRFVELTAIGKDGAFVR